MIVLLYYVPPAFWHPDYPTRTANCFHKNVCTNRAKRSVKNKYYNIKWIEKYWEDKTMMSGV